MDLLFFIKGVILGFSIAAPLGPIGVLCIRRTLAHGMLNGFLSGLGTATADAVYGCIAAFSLTLVSGFLLDNKFYLHLFGGLFLLYLGFNTFRSVPAEKSVETDVAGLLGAYSSSFILTLANPMTLLSFTAVFAGLGLGVVGRDYLSAGMIVFGVFVGSMLWWILLSASVNILRAKFNTANLKWINQLSGLIIISVGGMSLLSIAFG